MRDSILNHFSLTHIVGQLQKLNKQKIAYLQKTTQNSLTATGSSWSFCTTVTSSTQFFMHFHWKNPTVLNNWKPYQLQINTDIQMGIHLEFYFHLLPITIDILSTHFYSLNNNFDKNHAFSLSHILLFLLLYTPQQLPLRFSPFTYSHIL